jgi:hypothetical protein
MKSSGFYAVIGLGVLLAGGIIWFSFYHVHPVKQQSVPLPTRTASTTPLTGLSIYTNGTYGFSIFFPGADVATTTFDVQYHLPATWRVNALPDATGTPIFEIIGYKISNATSYPRYYEAEVRVGASSDPKEVATCEKSGNGEVQAPDLKINGIVWKAFTLEDDAMMQYLSGMSYRTIHDGQCYALEQIQTGSSYRDNAPSPNDISDTVLKQKYQDLDSIVQSFVFARP